jgi:hypothetical protein
VQSLPVATNPSDLRTPWGSLKFLELLYAATVFLSSFLLFQIQPIIAKMILPWFGGSSAVWSTCMLFFQAMLLLGYVYAHWLQGRFTRRREALTHIAMLAISLVALPIAVNPSWKPSTVDSPSLRILALLVVTVGLPYFLVSTTSSLLQAWYARTHAGAIPYRLFALSNFASMLALVSYPLLVEPMLPARLQGRAWSVAYVGFAILCGATGWFSATRQNTRRADALASPASDGPPPTIRARLLWIALAACASTLLLAVTTFLTQDVAAVPFLWILPLVLYLVTFIVCFEAPKLYYRPLFIPLAVIALAAMASGFVPHGWHAHMPMTVSVYTASLLVCCMVCHGELAARKPHPRYLTGFYVMISVGGAVGGLFVGLVAPNFFNADYEFPVGMVMCATLVVGLALWPRAAWMRAAMALLLCGYVVYIGAGVRENVIGYRALVRNFYGLLSVDQDGDESQEDSVRWMSHGVINHGGQMLNEAYRREPVFYFCPPTGIGRAMTALGKRGPIRAGILGLGCGTLAAYGRAGDTYRIYEINPAVLDLANREFTYLKDTPAKIEVSLGDGRLSLEREPSQQFDVLVMDAFSGDSVPVHLITREAFELYFRHLKPGGLLAVNITNTYLDLRPVIARAASHFGKIALLYSYPPQPGDLHCYYSDWALVADPSLRESAPELERGSKLLTPDPNFRMWTDDFSNMWSILR